MTGLLIVIFGAILLMLLLLPYEILLAKTLYRPTARLIVSIYQGWKMELERALKS
jgi:hypothetical protein